MDGINLASVQFEHSSFSEAFGSESANVFVRSTCKSTIFFKVEGAIACWGVCNLYRRLKVACSRLRLFPICGRIFKSNII